MSNPEFEAARAKIIHPDDESRFLAVGYYFSLFAQVELWLTTLLAHASGSRDYPLFEIMCRGMDARVKVERFKAASKYRNIELGDAFRKRLDYFENTLIPLRNDLAHKHLHEDRSDTNLVHLTTIGAIPFEAAGFPSQKGPRPKALYLSELLEKGYWLRLFVKDLKQVLDHAGRGEPLEIGSPLSPLPKADQPRPRQQDAGAKLNRRERRREKASQRPQG